jgi:eukaryotic-like serine/threonine-protein kinase
MVALPLLAPGALFAHDFRIVRPLREGGMGAVYVAEQVSTGKLRALKTMHARLVADAGLRDRFTQEARVAARIESEHVVDVVASGVDGATGMPWLAMGLLKGETVADALAHGRAREPRFPSEVLLQLGAGLTDAHEAGVVHRDLKPENLFLAVTKRADVPFVLKVLDFGIAKLLSTGAGSVTAAVGTPLWMAPEQTERAAVVTPATDVWAYGLLAFQVLTGQSYWHVGTAREEVSSVVLLRQIVLDPLPLASVRAAQLGLPSALPHGFDPWFARCVARSPAARFEDGREALAALRTLLGAATSPLATPLRLPRPGAHAAPAPIERKWSRAAG